MKKYNPKQIESKWQRYWETKKLYRADDKSKKPKYYQLETFPYPSAAGLHVGHPKGYIAEDIHARYMRMNGRDVLYTMGWDAFGLPTENYAIKVGKSPKEVAKANVKNFKRQLKMFGFSYDWEREINTSEPEYYKWTQWLFLQLYKAGMAYQKLAKVNWCPKDQTVLANEQVVTPSTGSGQAAVCERCGTEIVQKEMKQWFFRITDYADRLLADLNGLNWPEETVKRQKDWIGRSTGAEIEFPVRYSSLTTQNNTQKNAEFLYEDLTYKIRGILFEMKKILGLGHKEQIYHNALEIEFKKAGLKFESKKNIPILYEGKNIGVYQPDFIIENKVLIELKALPEIGRSQTEQVWSYLKGCDYKLALLVNFGGKDLDIKRVVYDLARQDSFRRNSASSQRESATLTSVKVFTTRPDTLFGATYLVLAPEHSSIKNLESEILNLKEVKEYIENAKRKTELQRKEEAGGKTGVELKGVRVINPATKEKIPVWVADYVLGGYGSGAIMAVPAHDQRDFEFATKFNLPIKMVICPNYPEPKCPVLEKAYDGHGYLVASGKFDGMNSEKARWEIIKFVGGKKQMQYKLRDWSVSRQRYWGVPIPIIYCNKCGAVPVPEEDLPVKLPDLKDYRPKGMPPLASSEKFIKVKCPKCGGTAQRDPETLDTFVDSSWYYLRYVDPENDKKIFDGDKAHYWLPVDLYVIGAEHAVLHLLYSRFITKFLHDQVYLDFTEPFLKLRHLGLILGSDGQKMSKSKGNVVNPDEIVSQYGADAVRLYEMFMGPLEDGQPWNPKGVVGTHRFLNGVWNFIGDLKEPEKEDKEASKIINKYVKEIGEDIKSMKFNTAISGLMKLLNELENKWFTKKQYGTFLKLLAPFAPHIAEELWANVLGNKKSIHLEEWPEYDETLLAEETATIAIQINGKLRDTVEIKKDLSEKEVREIVLKRDKIKHRLNNKEIRRFVYIPNRLTNLVV